MKLPGVLVLIDSEVIYETQYPGVVPEHAGSRVRLLEATIEFAQLVQSASFIRHVIAQFEHDAESAFGPEQPLDDIAPARSIIAITAKRNDHSAAGFERLAPEVVNLSAQRERLASESGGPRCGAPPLELDSEAGRRQWLASGHRSVALARHPRFLCRLGRHTTASMATRGRESGPERRAGARDGRRLWSHRRIRLAIRLRCRRWDAGYWARIRIWTAGGEQSRGSGQDDERTRPASPAGSCRVDGWLECRGKCSIHSPHSGASTVPGDPAGMARQNPSPERHLEPERVDRTKF
jgi:hypothetical protein